MRSYLRACMNRNLFPLCQLPGVFPKLGLVLGVHETRYGAAATVYCLASGVVEEHDPATLDAFDPQPYR